MGAESQIFPIWTVQKAFLRLGRVARPTLVEASIGWDGGEYRGAASLVVSLPPASRGKGREVCDRRRAKEDAALGED